MKTVITFCFVLAAVLCVAQENQERIFNTFEEAAYYFSTTQPEDLILHTYFEDEDAAMYNFFINRSPGEVLITGTQAYKVQGFKNTTVQNCSIIELDATLPETEIEKLEKLILKKYTEGVPFEKLLAQFSRDKNTYMADYTVLLDNADDELASAINAHPDYKIYVVNLPSRYNRIVLKNGPLIVKKTVTVFTPKN